ncbi:amino acid ABC transporter permease [Leucobacter sp. M11]|uniref:amino acid ABC transporter permease n=1 Tax=Leucobacter sp. M11 TaxID=2993565 RepID=UPI002D7ED8CE|nr:amino acid ABC transporter permease [Leucobacter sp. M11]MEB4614456.1 amino acid ABC transporter permease [Leucobacter sp. M11]
MSALVEYLPLFGQGILRTLSICLWGGLGALLLGTLLVTFRISPVPILQRIGTGWVSVMRNVPLAVVVFFLAFGLPEIGIRGSYFWFGVSALAVYTAAFVCEALRSGINSVPIGQAEAARALGMPFRLTLLGVIVPQAIRTATPPLANTTIAMIKDSALIGAIGVGGDLFSLADTLSASRGVDVIPVLIGVVLGYLLIIAPTSALFTFSEKRSVVRA